VRTGIAAKRRWFAAVQSQDNCNFLWENSLKPTLPSICCCHLESRRWS